jgi:hypothetical protein
MASTCVLCTTQSNPVKNTSHSTQSGGRTAANPAILADLQQDSCPPWRPMTARMQTEQDACNTLPYVFGPINPHTFTHQDGTGATHP